MKVPTLPGRVGDAITVTAVGKFKQTIDETAGVPVFELLGELASDRQPFGFVVFKSSQCNFEQGGQLADFVCREVGLEDGNEF